MDGELIFMSVAAQLPDTENLCETEPCATAHRHFSGTRQSLQPMKRVRCAPMQQIKAKRSMIKLVSHDSFRGRS